MTLDEIAEYAEGVRDGLAPHGTADTVALQTAVRSLSSYVAALASEVQASRNEQAAKDRLIAASFDQIQREVQGLRVELDKLQKETKPIVTLHTPVGATARPRTPPRGMDDVRLP